MEPKAPKRPTVWGFRLGQDVEVRTSVATQDWATGAVVNFDSNRNIEVFIGDPRSPKKVTVKNPKLIRPFKAPQTPDEIERWLTQ